MITLEQVYKNILLNEFKYIQIFNQKDELMTAYFDRPTNPIGVTPQKVKKFLQDFVKENPGVYNIKLKKSSNTSKNGIVTYSQVQAFDSSKEIPVNSYFDLEKEREAIRVKITEEERQRLAQIDYAAKAAELDTMAGMLTHIVKTVFTHFNKPQPTGHLQGMNNVKTEAVKDGNLTPEQIELANEGLRKLMTVMSPELFYEVACKLQANPDKVALIKNFL